MLKLGPRPLASVSCSQVFSLDYVMLTPQPNPLYVPMPSPHPNDPSLIASSCLSTRPTSDGGTFPRWTPAGCPWGGGSHLPTPGEARQAGGHQKPGQMAPPSPKDPTTTPRPSGHLRSPVGQPEARAWGQEAPGLAALKASFNLGLLPPPPTPPAE